MRIVASGSDMADAQRVLRSRSDAQRLKEFQRIADRTGHDGGDLVASADDGALDVLVHQSCDRSR
jgi:hypothetical protein